MLATHRCHVDGSQARTEAAGCRPAESVGAANRFAARRRAAWRETPRRRLPRHFSNRVTEVLGRGGGFSPRSVFVRLSWPPCTELVPFVFAGRLAARRAGCRGRVAKRGRGCNPRPGPAIRVPGRNPAAAITARTPAGAAAILLRRSCRRKPAVSRRVLPRHLL